MAQGECVDQEEKSREEGLEVSSRGASIQRRSVGRCPREGAGNPGSLVLEEPEDAEGWGPSLR